MLALNVLFGKQIPAENTKTQYSNAEKTHHDKHVLQLFPQLDPFHTVNFL